MTAANQLAEIEIRAWGCVTPKREIELPFLYFNPRFLGDQYEFGGIFRCDRVCFGQSS